MFSQKSGVAPSTFARMSGVGTVTDRRPLHNSLTCFLGTPIASANALCVRPRGTRNSSVRISPAFTGLRFVSCFAALCIPTKNETPLTVDANRVEVGQTPFQLLEVVPRRNSQVLICNRQASVAFETDSAPTLAESDWNGRSLRRRHATRLRES